MIAEEPKYNQNQTQFSIEETILEKPLIVEPVVTAPPQQPQKSKLSPLAKGAIAVVSLLLVVLVIVKLNTPPPVPEVSEETLQGEISPDLDPLEQRLKAAENLLQATTPTSERLPFPPVATDLRIDQ